MQAGVVRTVGRPTKYTPELAQTVCERLIDGDSLRQICAPDDMPDRATIFRWLTADHEFATKYALAREAQADTMDDLILEEAKNVEESTAKSVRVRIDAYKWRAEKLKPKKYGGYQQIEHSGTITNTTDPEVIANQLVTMATSNPTMAPVIAEWAQRLIDRLPKAST